MNKRSIGKYVETKSGNIGVITKITSNCSFILFNGVNDIEYYNKDIEVIM